MRNLRGFTLLELLISIGIAGTMFAIMVGSSTGSIRSLAVADDYSYQSNEQLRAVDYLVRDLRRALVVTISPDGSSISMNIPDCYSSYDSQGNPTSTPVNPTIVNGAPVYGNPAKPLIVSYSVSSKQLIRTQTVQATNSTSRMVICSRVNNFALSFVALSTTITFTIVFDPSFQGASTALRTATQLEGTVAVRAIRFQ